MQKNLKRSYNSILETSIMKQNVVEVKESSRRKRKKFFKEYKTLTGLIMVN
jgi:hypothetical protein